MEAAKDGREKSNAESKDEGPDHPAAVGGIDSQRDKDAGDTHMGDEIPWTFIDLRWLKKR